MSNAERLTSANFDEKLENGVALVDFWAAWCGPCMMLMPTVEKIAREYDGKVKVGKVNVDEQMELAVKFGIEVIPTLLYFVDGKPVKKSVGAVSKEEIEKMFI